MIDVFRNPNPQETGAEEPACADLAQDWETLTLTGAGLPTSLLDRLFGDDPNQPARLPTCAPTPVNWSPEFYPADLWAQINRLVSPFLYGATQTALDQGLIDSDQCWSARRWEWTVDRTVSGSRLHKRIGSFLYRTTKGVIKLPTEIADQIAELASTARLRADLTLDIVTELDWEPGDYGDFGSCYWKTDWHNDARVETLPRAGAGAVRSYDAHGDGTGRIWIVPLPRRSVGLVPVYLAFNGYGRIGNRAQEYAPILRALLESVTGLVWESRTPDYWQVADAYENGDRILLYPAICARFPALVDGDFERLCELDHAYIEYSDLTLPIPRWAQNDQNSLTPCENCQSYVRTVDLDGDLCDSCAANQPDPDDWESDPDSVACELCESHAGSVEWHRTATDGDGDDLAVCYHCATNSGLVETCDLCAGLWLTSPTDGRNPAQMVSGAYHDPNHPDTCTRPQETRNATYCETCAQTRGIVACANCGDLWSTRDQRADLVAGYSTPVSLTPTRIGLVCHCCAPLFDPAPVPEPVNPAQMSLALYALFVSGKTGADVRSLFVTLPL